MIEPQDYSQPCIQVCGGGPSNWEVYQCNYNPSIQWNKGKEGQRGCKTISFGYNSHHNLWEEKLPCKTHFINQWKNISDYICTGELTIITTQFHIFSIRKYKQHEEGTSFSPAILEMKNWQLNCYELIMCMTFQNFSSTKPVRIALLNLTRTYTKLYSSSQMINTSNNQVELNTQQTTQKLKTGKANAYMNSTVLIDQQQRTKL